MSNPSMYSSRLVCHDIHFQVGPIKYMSQENAPVLDRPSSQSESYLSQRPANHSQEETKSGVPVGVLSGVMTRPVVASMYF